jgi:tetratricopeptide (TPR) repeat protein
MSLRFRRLIKIAPGIKIVVSKKGLGLNLGVRGAHLTVNTQGQVTRSIGIPGTGLSEVTRTRLKSKNGATKVAESSEDDSNQVLAKPAPKNFPSIFASQNERLFFKAFTTHDLKTYEKLFKIPELELVVKAIAVQLAIQDDNSLKSAAGWLNDIWERKNELLENRLFKKYVSKVILIVPVAPGVGFNTYLDIDALGLIYGEVLQQLNKPELAKKIVEQVKPNQVTAISLAEIELQLGEFDEVLALTDGIENQDDATAILLVFRAIALREQKHFEAAIEVFDAALASKSRNIDILHKALFERSKAFLLEGKNAKAKSDLEKILVKDSDYPGVKEALKKID